MKRKLALSLLLLSGCAHRDLEVAPGAPAGACRQEATAPLIGQQFDAKLEKTAKARTGAAAIRLVRPGEMVTMDLRIDRLTLRLDEREVVVSATCG